MKGLAAKLKDKKTQERLRKQGIDVDSLVRNAEQKTKNETVHK